MNQENYYLVNLKEHNYKSIRLISVDNQTIIYFYGDMLIAHSFSPQRYKLCNSVNEAMNILKLVD